MKELKELTVTISMSIEGKELKKKSKKYSGRSRVLDCFSLDEFGRILFIWDRIFNHNSTYNLEILRKYEDEFPKNNEETAYSIFEKYWINLEETLNKKFKEFNDGKIPYFPEENDFLKHTIGSISDTFSNAALPTKYGFLYFLHKFYFKSTSGEFEKELENIPEYIKEIVDSLLEENEKEE